MPIPGEVRQIIIESLREPLARRDEEFDLEVANIVAAMAKDGLARSGAKDFAVLDAVVREYQGRCQEIWTATLRIVKPRRLLVPENAGDLHGLVREVFEGSLDQVRETERRNGLDQRPEGTVRQRERALEEIRGEIGAEIDTFDRVERLERARQWRRELVIGLICSVAGAVLGAAAGVAVERGWLSQGGSAPVESLDPRPQR